jgi:nitrite reductase (NADH) large subunit
METQPTRAWQCTVCGYVHEGTEPPETCPVCGVSREQFEPHEPSTEGQALPHRWRCLVCDYEHEGPEPPETCPVCGAGADQFVEIIDQPDAAVTVPPTTGSTARIAIVGAGIAGLAAAEAARAADPRAEVVLYSAETELPYYRLNLTLLLAGEIGEAELPVHPEAWYTEQRIVLRLGVEVRRLLPGDHLLELADGSREPFDRMVLAVGARPFIPPIPGADLPGVTCLRRADDARGLLGRVRNGARCVCIGGGILGLEIAGALARQGAPVHLLESFDWLLPRQLNRRAGEVLGRHVKGTGIELICGASTAAITGSGKVEGVALKDGRALPADLVILATGVRANLDLAREAGLEVAQGLVVSDGLVTSHPEVLAAGDGTEHRKTLYGLWTASLAQGRIAGANAVGRDLEFKGIPRANTLKVLGLPLFSIGVVEPGNGDCREFEEELEDRYFRFLFDQGRLVGAILLGDASLATRVAAAVQEERDFSSLLAGQPEARQLAAALAEG